MPGRERVPSFQLPSGTTAERDGSYNLTTVGNIFYNTDTSNVEVYVPDNIGNNWFHLNLNNSFKITIINLSRDNQNDTRYQQGMSGSVERGAIVDHNTSLYNQYIGYNNWITVHFDRVIEGRRSGVGFDDLFDNSTNAIIIPSDGKYEFDFGSSAGWLGDQSHGTTWVYFLKFVITCADSDISGAYYSYPAVGHAIQHDIVMRVPRLIHNTRHQYVMSNTHFQPFFMNKNDKVSVEILHTRNSHTLLGTDEKGRNNQIYSTTSTDSDAYNYEYLKKIAPRLTVTRVS